MANSFFFDVTAYGALGVGTDDTAAIQSAVSAACVAGGVVFFPRGIYGISQTILINQPRVYIAGSGRYESVINVMAPNIDAFKFFNASAYYGGGIRDLYILYIGATTIAGNGIVFSNVNDMSAERITIKGMFDGFSMLSSTAPRLRDIDVTNIVNDGFIINGGGNQYLHNCTGFQNTSGGGSCFHVVQTIGFWLDSCVSSSFNTGFFADANAASVYDGFIENCDFDDSTTNAVNISSSNGGAATLLKFSNCRGAFSTQCGLVVQGAATDMITFDLCSFSKNVQHGANLISGGRVRLKNCDILGNSATGAGYNGIKIQAMASIDVQGCVIGAYPSVGNNQGYAIEIDSSFSGPGKIANNDLSGNSIGGVFNSSTSSSLAINNNIGYNPVGMGAPTSTGTSGSTLKNGAVRATWYFNQSATNTATVSKGGQTVATLKDPSTSYAIDMGPNDTCSVSWITTQPTYTPDVH